MPAPISKSCCIRGLACMPERASWGGVTIGIVTPSSSSNGFQKAPTDMRDPFFLYVWNQTYHRVLGAIGPKEAGYFVDEQRFALLPHLQRLKRVRCARRRVLSHASGTL